jgi:hypothetical protein
MRQLVCSARLLRMGREKTLRQRGWQRAVWPNARFDKVGVDEHLRQRDDGEPELKYSYGEDYQADACNTGSCDTKSNCGTAPVGSFPKCQGQGPYAGVFDMVGNVSEWVDERGNGSATSVGYRGSDFDRDAVISGCNGVTSTAGLPTLASPYTGIRCCAD